MITAYHISSQFWDDLNVRPIMFAPQNQGKIVGNINLEQKGKKCLLFVGFVSTHMGYLKKTMFEYSMSVLTKPNSKRKKCVESEMLSVLIWCPIF